MKKVLALSALDAYFLPYKELIPIYEILNIKSHNLTDYFTILNQRSCIEKIAVLFGGWEGYNNLHLSDGRTVPPFTINDFITDCKRLGVKLYFKEQK